MSSVNDIMAVLLEDPTKTTITTSSNANKPGRGRPAGRGNKQISSSITITSKPTTNTPIQTSNISRPVPNSQQQQISRQQTTEKKQSIGMVGPAQISRLEQEFVKV